MLIVSAVPPDHCPQLLCGAVSHCTGARFEGDGGKEPQLSSSAANCAVPEPHSWLELFAPRKGCI